MGIELKSTEMNPKLLESLSNAEFLTDSEKQSLGSKNPCHGLCDTCDCYCNQPCDHTTPNCYTL